MAGYSLAGQIAKGVSGPLFARSLFWEDAAGNRVAFCAVDLMSASRFLFSTAAGLTKDILAPGQLMLTGTHTHTGPGRFYGNKFYDEFAQVGAGFHGRLAYGLAQGIADSLHEAERRAVAARVGCIDAGAGNLLKRPQRGRGAERATVF